MRRRCAPLRLRDGQRLLAQHRAAARPAGPGRPCRASGTGAWPRARFRSFSRSPPTSMTTLWRRWPRPRAPQASPPSSPPTRRWIAAACAADMPRRPAGFRARRCSRARRGCWRACRQLTDGKMPLIGVGGVDLGRAGLGQDPGRRLGRADLHGDGLRRPFARHQRRSEALIDGSPRQDMRRVAEAVGTDRDRLALSRSGGVARKGGRSDCRRRGARRVGGWGLAPRRRPQPARASSAG